MYALALGGYPIQPSFFDAFNEFDGQCNQVMKVRSIGQVVLVRRTKALVTEGPEHI